MRLWEHVLQRKSDRILGRIHSHTAGSRVCNDPLCATG
jgi:hypothetical protein